MPKMKKSSTKKSKSQVTRAQVDAAGKVAHEVAAVAYIKTYKRVLAAVISSDSAQKAA